MGGGGALAEEDEFGDALGGAHDAARADGFVGGDHQELTGAIFEGGGGENGGAEDVVGDDRDGILLHERDVFEGGGVEDDCRAIFLEDVVEEGGVADVAENGDAGCGALRLGSACCRAAEFGVDFVEILFGEIEKNEKATCIRSEAFGQCGANAAAGAGDQVYFIGKRIVGESVERVDQVSWRRESGVGTG